MKENFEPFVAISDLHLTPEQPVTLSFTLDWLRDFEGHFSTTPVHLYVLGDLFDFWVGDECLDYFGYRPVFERFQSLVDRGISVYFSPGNRDFLLSSQLLASFGVQTLNDPYQRGSLLFSHGDRLCTDDEAYMQWYRQCRSPSWQKQFLSLSFQDRLALALKAREVSGESHYGVRDIDSLALNEEIKLHPKTKVLIHGHTHWSDMHEYHWGHRLVLPDWSLEGNQARYGWIYGVENELSLCVLQAGNIQTKSVKLK
jgi:UDP-2,3-diacylglucosamine hydrolase